MFNKLGLRIISGISFLLFLVTGFLGLAFGMVNYGPPEVMAKPRDPPGISALLMVAALALLLTSIITLITSFFKKSR
jgi:hypothetical protein